MDMTRVDEVRFDVAIKTQNLFKSDNVVDQAERGSFGLAAFLMGLNIASLGLFDWDVKYAQPPCFSIIDNENRLKALYHSSLVPEAFTFFEPKIELTGWDVVRATQIMRAMAQQKEDHVFSEYMKGIFHFGLRFYGLTFRKEAFANFYRALEFFVTDRILRRRRLNKETRQFEEAFDRIGIPENV